MAQVFKWAYKPGASGTIEFRTRTAKFGDGYEQVVKDGINNVVQSWPVDFEGSKEEMQPIYDFLVEHGGATSFWWTPPGSDAALLWKAPTFTMTSIGAGVYSVSAEFKQSFAP